MIFSKLPPLFKALRKCCPATTSDNASCLGGPNMAIHQKRIFATSESAAPGTKIDDAAAQRAAPATKNRHTN